jgi:hypothetical protein
VKDPDLFWYLLFFCVSIILTSHNSYLQSKAKAKQILDQSLTKNSTNSITTMATVHTRAFNLARRATEKYENDLLRKFCSVMRAKQRIAVGIEIAILTFVHHHHSPFEFKLLVYFYLIAVL